MDLVILSTAPGCYSSRRLHAAATERGHNASVLNTLRFSIDLSESEPDLQFRGHPLDHVDAVIPRIGNSITYFGTAVVRQFEQMDVYTPNTAEGIANSRDKLRATQMLSRSKIGIPSTTFVRDRKDVRPAIALVGGAPVVIKLLEGTQGIGVILAQTAKMAESVIEAFLSTRQDVLVQRFIAESRGTDVRALVVGDRVVAAMRRRARGDEFRSNVHRGGTAEAIELEPAFASMAVKAARVMGLGVAGVDILESDDGPLVLEVNSSPGLEGIEQATNIDVAGAIVDYVASRVVFPELDIRQRLSVTAGYGVAELVIGEFPDEGLTTVGSLRERDIGVLSLSRGTQVVPNPRDSHDLEFHDRLLCFGKLDAMRGLIPPRIRRRPRLKKLPPEFANE
jgi:ribosomal protein S6--L-glutamate ligase